MPFSPRLDDHGQPFAPYNAKQITRRAIAEMLGFVRGMLADGRVTDDELVAFSRWLQANPDATMHFPGNAVAERVRRVLEDRVVTEEEREDLTALLQQATGDVLDDVEAGAVVTPTRIAFTDPTPTVLFEGSTFVLTGRFVTGTRAYCERQIVERGGLLKSAPTHDTNFVVVGSIGSAQWLQSTHGTKIEAAVSLRDRGHAIAIIPEEEWVIALGT